MAWEFVRRVSLDAALWREWMFGAWQYAVTRNFHGGLMQPSGLGFASAKGAIDAYRTNAAQSRR